MIIQIQNGLTENNNKNNNKSYIHRIYYLNKKKLIF